MTHDQSSPNRNGNSNTDESQNEFENDSELDIIRDADLEKRKEMQLHVAQMLLAANLLTKSQLDEALTQQSKMEGDLIEILFVLEYLTPDTLLDFLIDHPGVVNSNITCFEIRPVIISIIPDSMAIEHQILPIDLVGKVLIIGCMNNIAQEVIAEVEKYTGCVVKPVICRPTDVQAAIERYYKPKPPSSTMTETPVVEPPTHAAIDIDGLRQPLRLLHIPQLIREIKSLPVLPETVEQVRNAMQNPNSSINVVVDIITLDPPIAAKVLGVANSAAYGFVHRIHDLNHAVALLGLHEIYSIVLSAAVADLLQKWKHFDYQSFWFDSVCSAIASRIVAKASGRRQLVGIFSAGLLHDIGIAALWEIAPQRCAQIDPTLTGLDRIAAEEELLGLSHTEAGYELANHWGLPVEITESIRFHHQPQNAPNSKIHAAVVCLADVMLQARNFTPEEYPTMFKPYEVPMEILGIDAETGEAMLEEYLSRHTSAAREAFG